MLCYLVFIVSLLFFSNLLIGFHLSLLGHKQSLEYRRILFPSKKNVAVLATVRAFSIQSHVLHDPLFIVNEA